MPNPGKVWTPKEVLDIAFRHPPQFAPDASYEYSNTNYALLGLIAEKAGGSSLAQQFRDRLFGPVGLAQTSLPAVDDTSIPLPYSHGYMYGGSYYALADDPYPAEMQAAARPERCSPSTTPTKTPPTPPRPAGRSPRPTTWRPGCAHLSPARSSTADYQRQWTASLRAEDPAAPDGQKYGYGISYQRFGPNAAMYYHGGELPGFNSFMGYDPDNDVTLVIWTNLTLSPEGKTTAQGPVAHGSRRDLRRLVPGGSALADSDYDDEIDEAVADGDVVELRFNV